MVYITSWEEFVERSVALFREDPDSTRYVLKYRHCDGKLVLKVTDNRQLQKARKTALTPVGNFDLINAELILNRDARMLMLSKDANLCLKYKTEQAQEAKKMEKLNNIFFTLMAWGPEVDLLEVAGKDPVGAQPTKRGRGRKQ